MNLMVYNKITCVIISKCYHIEVGKLSKALVLKKLYDKEIRRFNEEVGDKLLKGSKIWVR